MPAFAPALVFAARILAPIALCAVANAQWELVASPTSPPVRYYGGMTFDVLRNRTVVFGGALAGPGFRNDTWTFDGQTWTQLTPPTSPGPRGHFQMVHDFVRDRIVLFGGRGGTGFNPPYLNQTWEFDGTTWAQIATANAPSARQWFGMAFDPVRGKVVLYGGQATSLPGDSDETWEYDGVDWSLRSPTVRPGPLQNAAMCFHRALNKVVLFSGIDVQVGGTSLTWAWDGLNWAQLPVTGLLPAPRTFARLAYDEGRQAAVLFGGMDPQTGTLRTDVWQFDGTSWRELLATGPVGRRGFGFVYDALGQRCVLFGGLNQSFQGVGDTWKFGPTWQTIGMGCPGSNGVPALAPAAAPGIARTYVARLTNLLPTVPFAVFATGFSATSWNGVPLPLAMDALGLTGCTLWISPDFLSASPALSGASSYSLTLPNDPLLVGQRLWQQGLSFEAPGFNPFGAVLSNATELTIGW